MSTKLAHQTQKTAGIPNGMRTATIAAVSGTAVTLSMNGGTFSSGVGVLGSYAPVVGDTVAVFRQDSSWLILGSVSPAGIGGRIGTQKLIANSALLTAVTVVSTLTVNLVSGQTYALFFYGRVSSGTIGDFILARIKNDSVSGADLGIAGVFAGTATNSGFGASIYGEYTATATGSKTFVTTLELSAGAGSVALRASATGPAFFYCDNIPGGGIYQ